MNWIHWVPGCEMFLFGEHVGALLLILMNDYGFLLLV
jgi:hypothetical protein